MVADVTLPFRQIDSVFGQDGPAIIAEIGAADGVDTATYAARYPRASLFAFEPLPANVEKLNALREKLGIRVYPCALGAENKVATDFWVSGGRPPSLPGKEPWPYSSSLLEPAEHKTVHPWCTFERHHTSVCRLDHLMEVAPDYIHMDVQGAELLVLEGASRLLPDVRAVWMEVANVELYRGQPLRRDVGDFMRDRGFELVGYYGSHISGDEFWKRR